MEVKDVYGNLPVLETERTIPRKIRRDDLNDMFNYCSDEAITKYTTWYRHQSLEDTRGYIDFILSTYDNQEVAPWGIEDKSTGKLIGTCGFMYWSIDHARAELGYALAREYWNKGVMSEVATRIIQFGFEVMELIRIEARCHPDNIGSARVMEKSGMTFEGILRKHLFCKGHHQDVKMYSILREEAGYQ